MRAALAKPFRHEVQEFTWLNDSWDIARLLRDIDAGALVLRKESFDRQFIESYAKDVLGLVKDLGANQKSISMLMHVNAKDALGLPQEALQEPLVFLHARKNKGLLRMDSSGTIDHVLGDGNHRVAKAFFEDVASLEGYVLTSAQSRRYLQV